MKTSYEGGRGRNEEGGGWEGEILLVSVDILASLLYVSRATAE